MNKVSAMGLAGALLIAASVPALAQNYPADPGYDQGQDYGQPGAPAEDLPPGAAYGVDPVYGGYADQGGYPEDDSGYGGPDRGPVYGDENLSLRPRHHLQPRYGEDVRRHPDGLRRNERRRVEGDYGRDRRDRNGGEPQHRRQHPSNQDMSDQ